MTVKRHIPIADLAEVNPSPHGYELSPDEIVSFIPMSDVSESGRWVTRQRRRLRDIGPGYTSFAEGDVLFAKITPCMENGKGAHAVGLENGIGFGSTEFHVLRARRPNDPRFIFHWLQTRVARQKAIAYMSGSAGQQRVQADFFAHFTVPAINADDQRRIAAVLDTVDAAIAQTEAVIAKLKSVRAGLLHDLLTRGLDANGHLRPPPDQAPHLYKDSPMGKIPREWEAEPLWQRLQASNGLIQTGPFGSQLHANEYSPDGIPVVMPQDICEGRVTEDTIARIPTARANELRRHRVSLSDILIARRGDLSRCAVVTAREIGWLCGTGCLLIRFHHDTLMPDWLSLAYRHDRGQRQISARAVGTTMVNLNTTILHNLMFAFPPIEEQRAVIARLIENDRLFGADLQNLKKARLLKSGLLSDLLTGRVAVQAGTI